MRWLIGKALLPSLTTELSFVSQFKTGSTKQSHGSLGPTSGKSEAKRRSETRPKAFFPILIVVTDSSSSTELEMEPLLFLNSVTMKDQATWPLLWLLKLSFQCECGQNQNTAHSEAMLSLWPNRRPQHAWLRTRSMASPWNLHGGRREPTLAGCSHTHLCTVRTHQ